MLVLSCSDFARFFLRKVCTVATIARNCSTDPEMMLHAARFAKCCAS
jgi:hypothetical protein